MNMKGLKVLIVNKFYYPRGGDCVCTLNLERLLGEHGVETAVFAMHYPENLESRWSRYFAAEVSFGGSLSNMIRAGARTLGMGGVRRAFRNILDDFRPDVVHLNNIHSYLSPVLAGMAKKSGARVVWTMHDYKLLCPSYSCLNSGRPCELCFENKFNVVRNRCMKGSLPASVIAWLEAMLWRRERLCRSVDVFICPSEFMRSRMIAGGFPADKLVTLCNFIDPVKLDVISKASTAVEREPDSYCYIGRLSEEKGIDRLLEMASELPYRLYVAGDGPLGPDLRERYGNCENIKFLGRLSAGEVAALVARCHASVIPSRWYENNPLGVIESLCAGTPVIGAGIGGIPELVDDAGGAVYAWDDREAQRRAVIDVMSRRWDHNGIAAGARERFSPSAHYDMLLKLY